MPVLVVLFHFPRFDVCMQIETAVPVTGCLFVGIATCAND